MDSLGKEFVDISILFKLYPWMLPIKAGIEIRDINKKTIAEYLRSSKNKRNPGPY